MDKNGFSIIFIAIAVAVISTIGIGGYIFVSKQAPTLEDGGQVQKENLNIETVNTEKAGIQEILSPNEPETEKTTQPAEKTEPAPQKEPVSVRPYFGAVCSDGTLHNRCSTTQPFICTSGKLQDDCRTCGCPDSRVCFWDGTCGEIIFPKKDIEPHKSWDKINFVLSGLGVTPVLIDNERRIAPNEPEREQMKESLAYIVYIFDELFRGTPINSFLKEFKEIRLNVGCCYDLVSGHIWKGDLESFQISLLSSFLEAEGIPSTDRYMIIAIHEIGHVIHQNLSNAEPQIRKEFDAICWAEGELKIECQEREKSFVPFTMTALKPLAKIESQKSVPPYYYSLTDVGEDFAETLVAYIASPDEFRGLAEKFPKLVEKYKFMKTRIFGNKEF